jgi:phage-related protein
VYNVVFESDSGGKYVFGKVGNTVFDMDLGNGVPVNIGTSQGFSQVGETMQSRNVSGRTISVKGAVYGNVQERKKSIRNIISPFSCGRLVFEGQYYIRVCVKSAPTFSSVKNDGRFTMQFYAPYPFFKSVNEKNIEIGSIKPLFSFPVNYSVPHKFGENEAGRYRNIYNDSDVNIPFAIHISSSGASTNPVIANLKTFKSMKINGTIGAGDFIDIYRNDDNVLQARLTSNGVETDIISWIDESSNLFELQVGDNLISATDDTGGANLSAKITYNPVVVAVYES